MHGHERNLIVVVVILAAVALHSRQQSDVLNIFGEVDGYVANQRIVAVGAVFCLLVYIILYAVEEGFDVLEF